MSVTLDHKFNTRNTTEEACVAMIENASDILSDLLNVSFKLRMERMAGWSGTNATHAGKYIPRTNLIKINYRNLQGQTFDRILEVLGHEVRHAVQSQRNIIDDDIPDTNFSHRWLTPAYIRYLNKPVEKDARKYQRLYAEMVRTDPRWLHEDAMSTQVDGQLMIDDYQATYEAMGVEGTDIRLFVDDNKNLFWFNIKDVPNAKKFTKAVFRRVWADHREQLISQPFIPIQRVADMLDITS